MTNHKKKLSSKSKFETEDSKGILSEQYESLILLDDTGNEILRIDHSDEPVKLKQSHVVKLKPSL